ncbi:M16 family metallopeptidase [Aurantiacibacter poecillastricola]|uniref:M16 family metallopeptidase n=1 Tax=Aurantiacibacter poecillastricola TaxID=3064385 RepID=UPI00273D44D9|nr:insulinase family protein [Aurantiacibacter sp. 219JJ12-13]MDP5262487.1 insulinase family protein [Aurantiacibacter sp. 219JJ12-13]
MNLRPLAAALAALALPLALSQPLSAQAPELAQQEWDAPSTVPAEIVDIFPDLAGSDLPFDSDYRVGQLENGLRYVIRPNATPPEQGLVQLWVDFGSAAEREDEQGYAHFIEHMAFNGTTNLPEGEFVRLLEREGLAFGADTNASTGFDSTSYRLDLPRNDEDLLGTALMVMREVASEITFADDAVEREKGIILSERRVRDTFQLRSLVDNLGFLYPGSRISERLPIGTIETIEAADGEALRSLYERYYQPENMLLVVVGDYEAQDVEALIRGNFASWQGGELNDLPPFGPVDLTNEGATSVYLDDALSEQVTISANAEYQGETDTVASRRARVLRQIGYGIINRRLQSVSRQEDPPFRGAGLSTSDFFEEGRTTSLTVAAAEGEWDRALAVAQQEYRRALEFGFTEAEVAEQVANLSQAIESNAAGAATRPNAGFITGAVTLWRDGQVPTTPESALERWNAHKPEITPEAVLAALREELVPLDNPLIRYEGRTPPVGGETALRAAWQDGMALALEANDETAAVDFAYTDFGEPGEIVSDTVTEPLGIRTVRFANNVMLNLKSTELEDDRIQVQVNIDGGTLLDTPDNPLATTMFNSLASGGLGEHTLDELQTVLAGRRVGVGVDAAPETFRLSAVTTPRDLELQLQVFTATIADAAYRPTGEAQFYRSVENWFARHYATPASALGVELGGIASDNDPRFSLRPKEEYLALTFAQLREDIAGRLANGAIEVALVGDFDEQRAIDLVAATLGTLPVREEAFGSYEDNRQRSFTADRSQRTIYHDGQPDQAMLLMLWPTRDDSDPVEAQQLGLLERVMQLELTDTLREELGQTYSPGADSDLSRVYPGYGTFDISAQVDTGQVDAAREAMLDTLERLRGTPVDEDTLLRARQPLLEAYDNALDTNGGWMNLVDRAQTEPERIERFLVGEDRLRAITPTEVQAMAQSYLDPVERLEVVVLPRLDNEDS